MVVTNLTDLSMLAVPPSNHLYEIYKWAVPAEVNLYIDRIGQVPIAPVELLVAFDDESPSQVLGFLMYLPVPTHSEACGVTYMAVQKTHRGQGIGSALMKMAIERYPHVELTCPVAKVGFYERLGFRVLDVHNTQVVMNTRSASTEGQMAIVDVEPIYRSSQALEIRDRLLARWGRKEMVNADAQLKKHVAQLQRQAEAYVLGRIGSDSEA
ncbi:putative acetyltransferase [Pseudomonas amygdali pv. lachrymans]|nr:putative acetyltransferase [Pseudomonas amygdali pv. lachrymans]